MNNQVDNSAFTEFDTSTGDFESGEELPPPAPAAESAVGVGVELAGGGGESAVPPFAELADAARIAAGDATCAAGDDIAAAWAAACAARLDNAAAGL